MSARRPAFFVLTVCTCLGVSCSSSDEGPVDKTGPQGKAAMKAPPPPPPGNGAAKAEAAAPSEPRGQRIPPKPGPALKPVDAAFLTGAAPMEADETNL